MPIRFFAAVSLLFMIACGQPAHEDFTTANFKMLLNNLDTVKTPTTWIWMDSLRAVRVFGDYTSYAAVTAAMLPPRDSMINIVYDATDEKDTLTHSFIVAAYTPAGKLVSKTLMKKLRKEPDHKWGGAVVMENDSLLELRQYYFSGSWEATGNPASDITQILIGKNGQHTLLDNDTETFEHFGKDFRELQLPFIFPDTPDDAEPLPTVNRAAHWFDLGPLLGLDFPKINKMGKVNIPGTQHRFYVLKMSQPILQYTNQQVDDALYVVDYDERGKRYGQWRVTGGDEVDNNFTLVRDFNVDSIGNCHFAEFKLDKGEVFENEGFSISYLMRKELSVQSNGRLKLFCNSLDVDMKSFDADSAIANYKLAVNNQQKYTLLTRVPGSNMSLALHRWKSGKVYVFEIVSIAKAKIIDAMVVAYKGLDRIPADEVTFDKTVFENLEQLPGTMNGPVRVRFKDKTLTMEANGTLSMEPVLNITVPKTTPDL